MTAPGTDGAVHPPPGIPPVLALAAGWSWRLLLIGGVLYFLATFVARLSIVSVPVFLALLLTALLHRPAHLLRRWLPAWLASIVTLVGSLLVLCGIGYLTVTRVQSQAGTLVAQSQSVIDKLRDRISGLPGIGSGSSTLLDKLQGWVQVHSSMLETRALTVGRVAFELLTALVLTLFLTLFFLLDGERQWSWLVRLLPVRARGAANGAGHRAFAVLAGYISGTTIIALIHGIVIGTTLWLLGTPLVIVLAVLVFIGSFIPLIGAFLFGGLSVLVTLVTVGLWPALILLGVLLMENLLEAHVYQPLIMGRTVRLHPVAILLVLAAGGVLGGFIGAIAAIPVAAAVSASVKYLTGVEDINGHSVRDEDRMAAEPLPEVVGAAVEPRRSRARQPRARWQ